MKRLIVLAGLTGVLGCGDDKKAVMPATAATPLGKDALNNSQTGPTGAAPAGQVKARDLGSR